MTSSGIRHVDLRVGVLMHRWPRVGTLADAIGAFRAGLPGPDTLTISFLGAVNLSKPHERLDVVFGRILEDTAADGLLAGLDINMRPGDLATLDRTWPRCATSSAAACASTSTWASCLAPASRAKSSPASSPAG